MRARGLKAPGAGGRRAAKDVAECHTVQTVAQEQHVERLLEALRYEPCSPRCANWLHPTPHASS
ncbi:hypothetical protein AC529_07645 [Thermobifida cellulosilytica TB100]|uniref:Uncharacterized protein n=1 Tax=Thermobifida cellulosilytica TB100 TaxID=665004 RepID=A0A147KJ43_THECS|nr:hypothetical protein AC529_07645 [Thermobifida cellulosilytica TB100]